jgi:hypothetical protein
MVTILYSSQNQDEGLSEGQSTRYLLDLPQNLEKKRFSHGEPSFFKKYFLFF